MPIIATVTLKAVSLQLNGMLMKWKIQQAMQDDAIRTSRIHLGNRAEVFIKFYGEISSPPSHMSTWKILQKDLEVRRDLGNRASQVNRAHVKRPLLSNLTLSLGKGGWGVSQNLALMNSSSCFILLHHHLVKYLLTFLFCFFFPIAISYPLIYPLV